jgi:hypothetical protein
VHIGRQQYRRKFIPYSGFLWILRTLLRKWQEYCRALCCRPLQEFESMLYI